MIKDLGLIQAILRSATPPTNTSMIWYDTGANLHKYYNTGSTSWVSFAAAAVPLSTILASGNTTGATKIRISNGSAIEWENSGFIATMQTTVLTATRIYTLPNKSGTLAMLSDIAGALGLTGTLSADNTTSGHDIVMSNDDKLSAENGGAALNLRFGGTDGRVVLGSVGTNANTYVELIKDGRMILAAKGDFNINRLTSGDPTINIMKQGVLKTYITNTSGDTYIRNIQAGKKLNLQTVETGSITKTQIELGDESVVLPEGRRMAIGRSAVDPLIHLSIGEDTSSLTELRLTKTLVGQSRIVFYRAGSGIWGGSIASTTNNDILIGALGNLILQPSGGQVQVTQRLKLDLALEIKPKAIATLPATNALDANQTALIVLSAVGPVTIDEITNPRDGQILRFINTGIGS